MNTTCKICGKPLTDPISVELGIGPVCRISGKEIELARGGNLFTPRAVFHWGTEGVFSEIVWIIDENGGKSVTNDMHLVLQDISKAMNLNGKQIIYRDSQGVWDQVLISEKGVISFKSINERDMAAAVHKLMTHAH